MSWPMSAILFRQSGKKEQLLQVIDEKKDEADSDKYSHVSKML